MRMKSLGLVLLSGFGFAVLSVPGSTQVKTVGTKGADPYAGESGVIERADSVWTMAADGTGTHEVTFVMRVQSEGALREAGVLNVAYAANSEHVEYEYVRVRHKDGTVSETPVSAALEVLAPVTREAPFYSDLKSMQLPVKALGVGDTLDWKAKIVMTKAEAPGEFWGQETFLAGAVVLSQTIELRVPKDKYVNVWSSGRKPVETTVGEERVYRWSNEEKKPTTGAEADAEKEAKKKRVVTAAEELDEKEGKLPDIEWTTFKSWEAVGTWYRGLEGDRMTPDAEVKAKVAELTAGKTNEQEKVQAVYRYVSTNIRYIGVAFGIGRFQPHSADVVMQNRYGDCKDKHTLLAAMLAALGEHPDAVLIGAGIRFNEAVPTPAAFNHLITAVSVEGKPVFLDTTAEVAPYGMLMYVIRDHEALEVPETGPARVVRTPAKPAVAAMQKLDADGTLGDDGISTSRFVMTFRGDDEMVLRNALRQLTPAQYDQGVQQLVSAMSFGGTVSHAEISSIEDTAQPLTISFDYKREKGGDWDHHRILAQLMPVMLPRPDLKTPPIHSIGLGVPRVEVSTAAMRLPLGWTAEIPEAVHQRSRYATLDVTYRLEKGVMYSERRVEVLEEKVPVSDWSTYSRFAEKADLGNETYIQMVKVVMGTGKTGGTVSDGSETLSDDPAKLVKDAYADVTEQQFGMAEKRLDRASMLNPKQERLWSTYGYLKFQRDEMESAVADYKKEIELYPGAYRVYSSLAEAQFRLGRTNEGNETLKTWISLDEKHPEGPFQLGTMLMNEGKPGEAIPIVTSAIERMPEGVNEEPLRLLLGQVQLAAGMKEKGQDTLAELVHSSHASRILNEASYQLANAGLELSLAETGVRHALQLLESESQGWTLDEDVQKLRTKTRLMQASWDTLGWVLFREGKADEAKSYVQAAWMGRQSPEVGMHLGEILAAKTESNAALGQYDLALATVNVSVTGSNKVLTSRVTKDLHERIAALEKAGAESNVKGDTAGALDKIREISLGKGPGLDEVGEYKFLVSGGKVERLAAMGAKPLPGGEELLKEASLARLFPAGSQGKLVMIGMLTCHSGVWEVVLEP